MAREFKFLAGKSHNIDLSENADIEDILYHIDYGWMENYNQRALLFRMLCNSVNKKCCRSHMSQDNRIESVKFFTKEKDNTEASEIVHDCHDSFVQRPLDDFYQTINNFLDQFTHSDISDDYWNDIVRCLDLFEFKYEKVDKVEFWSSTKSPKSDKNLQEAYDKLSREQRKYVSTFMTALKTDMRNGRAKNWIEELVNIILTCLKSDDMSGSASSQHDTINTAMEVVFGDSDATTAQIKFGTPYVSTPSNNSSSLLSLSSLNLESSAGECSPGSMMEPIPRHIVVPDYCVVLPNFPGIFPLVFELKPAYQESHALVQNIQQMLSKLFFQDVVFGIIASPRLFQLSVIIKKDGNLHFASTNSIYFYQNSSKRSLELGELNKMCTFIFQVLKWASKSKCLLKKMDSILEECSSPGEEEMKTRCQRVKSKE